MNSHDLNFKNLISLLTSGASPNAIKIKWEGNHKDVEEIFESDIRCSTKIIQNLKYEKKLRK